MNPFNKHEATGIFLSVAIMAVALGVVRFKTDIFVPHSSKESAAQGAVVAVSQNTGNGADAELEKALLSAHTEAGKLVNLVVDDVRPGTGAEVKNNDVVVVNYIGTTQDGVKFDSSYDRGEPFVFKVGAGTVIQGWEKGLLGMKIGGQRILVIPSDMAYGNRQVGTISPNTPLVFAVELLEIRK